MEEGCVSALAAIERTAMKLKITLISAFLLLVMALVSFPKTADRVDLTVHEWGTFTSIAGEDGSAVQWLSYGGPVDLPCFVHSFGGFKVGLSGTVRMETPVLYFYGSPGLSENVKVRFPKGTITEWYPQQSGPRANNAIEWRNVLISREESPAFPAGYSASHYYAARETEAAPVQVGSEKEKFLFYRGVGTFPLPISAKATEEGKVLVKNLGTDVIDGLLLFENRAGKPRYTFVGSLHDEIALDSGSLHDNWSGLLMDLERVLIEQGLYQKEARAMIETWRDSWFEEGTRLFYIVPRSALETILPLDIQPSPSAIARVFVGRMEIITPAIQEDVRQAIVLNDRSTLEKYGRFLEPIARRIGAKGVLLDSVYSSYLSNAANCSR
jgi:hypothetical protein